MRARWNGPAMRQSWVPAFLALAALALAIAGCAPGASVGTRKGAIAADFSLPTLDGGAQNLRDYRGRVVVLNFWASWCGPCRAEMPDLQVAYEELRDRGLVVVGINQGEAQERAQSFVREFSLTFPILLDQGQDIGRQYGVRAYPTTFIIDRKGVIRDVIVGGPLSRTAIRQAVEGYLK